MYEDDTDERPLGATANPAVAMFERQRRLSFELGGVLTRRQLQRKAGPALLRVTEASAGIVALVRGDEVEVFSSHGYDPGLLAPSGCFPLNAPIPLAEAARTQRMIVLPDAAAWATRYPHIGARAGHPSVSVPVRWADEAQAAIGLSFDRPQTFDETQVAFFRSLGTQVGALLHRMEVHERALAAEARHRALAQSMAASLLPPALPAIPGYSLAARHETGSGDIGGDFIDSVPLPDGRWVIVVGDVQGRGHEAAAVGSLARLVFRAGTTAWDTPSGLLEHLNRALLSGLTGIQPSAGGEPGVEGPRFVTVAVAVLSPPSQDGRREVKLGLAGHPQPLLARAACRQVQAVGVPGGLLGLIEGPSLVDTTVVLEPGDALVMFTDGLTERHHGSRFFDEDAVAPVLLRVLGRPAGEIADAVIAAADEFAGEHRDDDTAVVVIQPV